MSNLTISNRTTNGVVISGPVFVDAILTATGAETWPAGAVLARVTASGKYVRFVPAGAGGAEVPKAVLTQAVEFTVAGDRSERPAISGQVRLEDLVDNADVAITALAVEQLRDFTIIALTTHQQSAQDNQ
jgi:hypothetical protein